MGSYVSDVFELGSSVNKKDLRSITHEMCTNDGSIGDDSQALPSGSYCVFKSGKSCPSGMPELFEIIT